MSETRTDTPKGFEYYTQRNLLFYNAFVLGFNNRFVWRCPTSDIEDMYARLATSDHCDIGIGTGYFLQKQHQHQPFTSLHLVDASAEAIGWVRDLFARVEVTSTCTDVSTGIPSHQGKIRSISLNYLLHCMKGPLSNKEPVLASLRNLAPAGTPVFGATIVNDDVHQNWLARRFLRIFNRNGMFDTSDDSHSGLDAMLNRHLENVKTRIQGSVLFFEGTLPSGDTPNT